MIIKLDAADLVPAAQWVAKYAMSARGGIAPQLAMVQVLSHRDRLTLSATNFETWARVVIPIEGDPGATMLPAALLAQVVRALPDGAVSLDVSGPVAVLAGGSVEFGLPTMDPHDFPQWPNLPPLLGVVDAAEFSHAVRQVASAASREKVLPDLCSVQVDVVDGRLWMAATDRYRVSVRTVALGEATGVRSGLAMVPASALSQVAGEVDGLVRVFASGADGDSPLFGVAWGDRDVVTRLLAGTPTNIRQVLERSPHTVHAEFQTRAVADAVRHALTVGDARQPRVDLTFGAGQVRVRASHQSARADLAALIDYDGPEFTIHFNGSYLLAALESLDGERAQMGFFDDKGTPRVTNLISVDVPSDHRHLVMPIRQT